MKILFVIPTLTGGGAERAMSNITMHLPSDVEADILLNSVSERDYPTNANIITLGMKLVDNKNLGYQFVAAVKRIFKLRKLKKIGNYDACISFMDSANICNIISGNRHCKVIVSVRAFLSKTKDFKYKFIVVPLDKLLYNKADKVVAVSRGIKDDLIHSFRIKDEKVTVITNGYDIKQIKEKSMEKTDDSILKGKFNYIAIGRYTQQKAFWHVIRAFKKVVEEIGDAAHLTIVGQGVLKRYLQEIIEKNDIEQNVTLLPYVNNPYTLLKNSDVFVMPSLWEGYSNALCEAIICGLPCIASDFRTSAREILAPETDYRFEQKDEIEFVKNGIIVPVCSGYRYTGSEPLEKAESLLADAMIYEYYNTSDTEIIIDKDFFDINRKVKQYTDLVRYLTI